MRSVWIRYVRLVTRNSMQSTNKCTGIYLFIIRHILFILNDISYSFFNHASLRLSRTMHLSSDSMFRIKCIFKICRKFTCVTLRFLISKFYWLLCMQSMLDIKRKILVVDGTVLYYIGTVCSTCLKIKRIFFIESASFMRWDNGVRFVLNQHG